MLKFYRGGSGMNIFICGSSHLSALDQKEIQKWLSQYARKHHIHLLCYKSLEKEVLRFFVENEHLAPNLFLYTLQPLHKLSNSFQQITEFLVEHGSTYSSFGYSHEAIYRSDYILYVKSILADMGLVLCFYNGDTHISVIPIDAAKEIRIDAVIYNLPGKNKELASRVLEDKLRIV